MRAALAAVMVALAAAPARSQPSRQASLDSLTIRLGRLDHDSAFHGVVLLADRGRIVHHSAHGLAHKGYRVPNRPDTKFNLASVGKTFTAVAIGQLVAAGKLRFADTLGRVMPDYPNREIARRVTIGQLLSHRSGMGLYWDALFKGNWTAVRTTADLLPFFVNDSLLFPPGTQWFYSNTGFAVLAMVVEKVSGQDYFDYVRDHILTPAGMTNTGYFPLDQDLPNMAVGYYRDEQGVLKNNLFTHTVRGGGAGGGWSTAADLLRWAEALRGGVILPRSVGTTMMQKQTDSGPAGDGYGFGFQIQTRSGRTLVGHTGGFPGIATFFFFDPERDRVGVLLSNEPGPSLRAVWEPMADYLAAPD